MSDPTDFRDPVFVGELRVLGHVVSVFLAEPSSTIAGCADSVDKYICIGYNKNQEALALTFWHEVFHIVLGLTGTAHLLGDDTEESTVIALENGLGPILRQLVPKRPKRKKTRSQPKLSAGDKIQSDSIDTIISILRAVNGK